MIAYDMALLQPEVLGAPGIGSHAQMRERAVKLVLYAMRWDAWEERWARMRARLTATIDSYLSQTDETHNLSSYCSS
jgi:hypothetical protein